MILLALASATPGQLGGPSGPTGNNLVELYGQGCAGNDGVVPVLYPGSNPVIGNAAFAMVGDPLPAGASTAYLLFAANHAVVSLGAGCDLLLDTSTLQFLTMPIVDGRAELPLPLPAIQALVGAEVYMQLAVIAPSPFGLAFSPGVRLEFSEPQSEFGTLALLSGTPGNLTPTYHHRFGENVESALPTSLAIQDIRLAGLDNDRALTRDARRERVEVDTTQPSAPAIALQDLGRLYRFQDNQTGELGFFVARSAAALMSPVMSSDLGTGDNYSPMVGIHASGDLLAAHVSDPAGDSVFLASLTNVPLAGTSLRVNISPPVAVTVDPATLVFVGDRVVALGTVHATSEQVLLSAPTDGSMVLLPVTVPTLGSGASVQTLDPHLLVRGDKVAVIGRDSTHSDVFVFDPTTSIVTNITQFGFPVIADAFGGPGQPRRSAMQDSGDLLFFTADDGGGRNGYLAQTDGSDAGALLGSELTSDDFYHPALVEIVEPTFAGNDLFVFVGDGVGSLDLFRFEFVGSSRQIDFSPVPSNLTQTSGAASPPFLPGGTMNIVASFRNTSRTALHIVQDQPGGLRDLIAVDFASGSVTNITGAGFTTSPAASFLDLSSVTFFRSTDANGDLTERAVAVTDAGITAWDAVNPTSVAPQSLGSGAVYDDVTFLADGSRTAYVESGSGPNTIHQYDWRSGSTSAVAVINGEIANGSLRYADTGGQTMTYAVGTSDPITPTDAVVESLSTVTGAREPVMSIPRIVVTGGESPSLYVDDGCQYTGEVDVTSFCVGKTSYMDVTINAPTPSVISVGVVIEGSGPTFLDGTRTKTVPCQTGTTRFPIKANAKPGCYNVCLNGQVFESRIRVIQATPTFRTAGTFSGDNKFPLKARCQDANLGEGTHYYGLGSVQNTMELRYTLVPKKACGSTFDIKRTVTFKDYANGVLLNSGLHADDDLDDNDEDLTPDQGRIYSADAPGLGRPILAAVVGDSVESRNHFTEWLTIRNKRRFERCSADILWESHVFLERTSPVNPLMVIDNAKSDISLGHDISLNSQHP